MAYLSPILKCSLAIAALLLHTPADAADEPNKGSVLRTAIADAVMKSTPRAFGSSVIRTLPKGSPVTYLGSSGIFYHVSDGRQSGYISAKSVVQARTFTSFSRSGEVTQSDMAAATKGFSPEVERENRKNRQLRYDLMDRAEQVSTISNPDSYLRKFRMQGKLGEYAND